MKAFQELMLHLVSLCDLQPVCEGAEVSSADAELQGHQLSSAQRQATGLMENGSQLIQTDASLRLFTAFLFCFTGSGSEEGPPGL